MQETTKEIIAASSVEAVNYVEQSEVESPESSSLAKSEQTPTSLG